MPEAETAPDASVVLNGLSLSEASERLHRCCGSVRWVEEVLRRRPFASLADLFEAAEQGFAVLSRDDYREAFADHPAIGATGPELAARGYAAEALSRDEQSRVSSADASTREQLHEANMAYRARFGFVFLVCASGKTAAEMLAILLERMRNPEHVEVAVAAGELAKIARLRLAKIAP
jgi:2-oxo-4-hydroxy-4-carboxy-5-ureidoimidazoline decarboxylase